MEKCFAMKKNGCSVLVEKKCPGAEKCAFYKSTKQFKEGQAAANARLARLPLVQQRYIADTYYNKAFPWVKDTD